MSTVAVPAYASPVNAFLHGEHRRPADVVTRFTGRLPAVAEAGRYHVYGARFCPASHRIAVLRALSGLEDAVTMSWVDGVRDGRGWAFREASGPDPVNGFTLLRQAYESSIPDYSGPVSVPVLWDRHTSAVVSSEPTSIGLDLLRSFGGSALYPSAAEDDIERAGAWIAANISTVVGCAVYRPAAALRLGATLGRLDAHLAEHRYLVGASLTDADVRLWVGLVRYDAGPNAHGAIGPRLDAYPDLWRYARGLYALPAFRDTTDFAAFTAPYATLPDWG